MDHLRSKRYCRLGDEMTCNGICKRYKAKGNITGGRYRIGQKRCQICELYLKWSGLWCPCCGYKLRSKPRNRKLKVKLQKETAATP